MRCCSDGGQFGKRLQPPACNSAGLGREPLWGIISTAAGRWAPFSSTSNGRAIQCPTAAQQTTLTAGSLPEPDSCHARRTQRQNLNRPPLSKVSLHRCLGTRSGQPLPQGTASIGLALWFNCKALDYDSPVTPTEISKDSRFDPWRVKVSRNFTMLLSRPIFPDTSKKPSLLDNGNGISVRRCYAET